MATIGSYEAKTHLPALLRRVEAGETMTITRHGHPIARIVPMEGPVRVTPDEAVRRMREFGKGRTLGPDLTIRDLIESGRR